jgi:hypothetical protein
VQSLAPFFVCLVFWALVPVLTGQTRHPRRRTLIALIALALFAHTYLLGYALVTSVGLLIAIFWRQIPRRPLRIGIAFFAVLMALYGIGLARQWATTSQRADQFASGHAALSGEALGHALRLVTGAGYADVRGQHAPAHDANLRDTLSNAARILWTLAIIGGVVRALWSLRASPGRERPGYLSEGPSMALESQAGAILLIWFLLPVLMMSYVSRAVHPFYLLLTVPAGHGLAAWGVTWVLLPQSPQSPQRTSWNITALSRLIPVSALLIFTVAINSLNTVRFAQNTAAFPGEDLPETLPLQQASQLRARLLEAGAPDLTVFSLMDEWSPIAFVGRNFRTENTATYGRAALVPPGGAIYVLFQKPGDPAPIIPPYAQQAEPSLILTDGTQITFWRVTSSDLCIDHPADIPSDINVSFTGWTLDGDLTPGAATTLDTFWRIDALHPERGTWSFLAVAHVLDSSGEQIAVAQGNAVSALTWAIGDTMVQRLTLTIPADAAGPLALDASLFDPVRLREDGTQGVNAIFQLPENGETNYTAEIQIAPQP